MSPAESPFYLLPVISPLMLPKIPLNKDRLQAIARVNRLYDPGKTYRLIVDHKGFAKGSCNI